MDLALVPEITPTRFDVADVDGFKAHLTEHGYAVVKCALPPSPAAAATPPHTAGGDRREAVTPEELVHARELLWRHFEGTEPGLERMQQSRPVGWKRDDPKTWTHVVDAQGKMSSYGNGGMTSTAHCVSPAPPHPRRPPRPPGTTPLAPSRCSAFAPVRFFARACRRRCGTCGRGLESSVASLQHSECSNGRLGLDCCRL